MHTDGDRRRSGRELFKRRATLHLHLRSCATGRPAVLQVGPRAKACPGFLDAAASVIARPRFGGKEDGGVRSGRHSALATTESGRSDQVGRPCARLRGCSGQRGPAGSRFGGRRPGSILVAPFGSEAGPKFAPPRPRLSIALRVSGRTLLPVRSSRAFRRRRPRIAVVQRRHACERSRAPTTGWFAPGAVCVSF